MLKLAIVIPAHNEERRIKKTLETYSEFFEGVRKKKLLDYEILVVINNTTDKTEEIVELCSKKNRRIRSLNFEQGGKGFAVIKGFEEALKGENDLIGFVDADMATSPEEYFRLVRSIENHHGVIAGRYMRGSVIEPKPSVQRKIAKWMFNVLVRSILNLPYRDTQCGAKLFRREAVEKVLPHVTMSQWAFDAELLYLMKKKRLKVREFATVWRDMEYSKINFWQSGPWMALGVIRLRLMNSSAKRFVRIYDKLIGYIPKT